MRPQKSGRRRPSLRSRALAGLTQVTIRPLAEVLPANRFGVVVSRRITAHSMTSLGPLLEGTRIEVVRPPAAAGAPQVRGEWVRSALAAPDPAPRTVILYVHGSAYAICSARTHRGITSRLAALTGLPVFSVDYRLAPRHVFPAAADDVHAAHDWLRDQGVEHVLVAGDSAGGHLAVDLALSLSDEGLPLPAGLALLSPVHDVTLRLAAGRERMAPDPMCTARSAAALVDLHVGHADPGAHPRLRLRPGRLGADFPPTLITAGGAEMLAADAVELARELRSAGARVDLDVWPGQMHVFQAFAKVLPEARRSLEQIAGFLLERAAEAAGAETAAASAPVEARRRPRTAAVSA